MVSAYNNLWKGGKGPFSWGPWPMSPPTTFSTQILGSKIHRPSFEGHPHLQPANGTVPTCGPLPFCHPLWSIDPVGNTNLPTTTGNDGKLLFAPIHHRQCSTCLYSQPKSTFVPILMEKLSSISTRVDPCRVFNLDDTIKEKRHGFVSSNVNGILAAKCIIATRL